MWEMGQSFGKAGLLARYIQFPLFAVSNVQREEDGAVLQYQDVLGTGFYEEQVYFIPPAPNANFPYGLEVEPD